MFICFPTFQFKPRNLPLVLHVILLLCNNIAFLAFTNKKLIACSDKGILDHACSKVLAGGQGVICESSQRMLCLKLLRNVTRKEERFALFKERETIFVRKMAKITTFLVWLCIVMLFSEPCYAFWSRRRRRRRPPPPPPCVPRNCVVSHWSNYGSCSYPCGTGGVQWKTRYVKKAQSCGGQCPYHLRESKACNVGLCANHGRPHSTGCSCRAGYTGKCCHNGKYFTILAQHSE